MKKSMVLWFHKDRNYRRKHVLSSKSQFDPTKEHAQPLGAAHFKLSTAHSFLFKYFIRYRISSRYFTNSFRRMKLNYLNGCLFLLAYVAQFSQFEHLMRLDFLRRAYTWRKKRVSVGWWLLRLTVKILVNLRLTVNTFPLFPLDIFFTVNFFYD